MNTKLGAILILLLSVFIIILLIRKYRKNVLSTRLMLFWFLIWTSIGFFAIFPQFLDYLMKFLNMGNRLFFLTSIAIIILFIIILYLTSVISRINHKLSEVAREIALLNYKVDKLEQQLKNDR